MTTSRPWRRIWPTSFAGPKKESEVPRPSPEVTTLLCQDTSAPPWMLSRKNPPQRSSSSESCPLGNRTIQEKNIAPNDPRLQLGDIADTASGCGPDVSGILGKVVQLAPSLMEATQQLTAQTVQGGIEQVAVETAKKGTQQVVKSAGQSLARQAGVQVTESTRRTGGKTPWRRRDRRRCSFEDVCRLPQGCGGEAENGGKPARNATRRPSHRHNAPSPVSGRPPTAMSAKMLGPLTQSLQQELRARGPRMCPTLKVAWRGQPSYAAGWKLLSMN